LRFPHDPIPDLRDSLSRPRNEPRDLGLRIRDALQLLHGFGLRAHWPAHGTFQGVLKGLTRWTPLLLVMSNAPLPCARGEQGFEFVQFGRIGH
jgi:hypothetical protein